MIKVTHAPAAKLKNSQFSFLIQVFHGTQSRYVPLNYHNNKAANNKGALYDLKRPLLLSFKPYLKKLYIWKGCEDWVWYTFIDCKKAKLWIRRQQLTRPTCTYSWIWSNLPKGIYLSGFFFFFSLILIFYSTFYRITLPPLGRAEIKQYITICEYVNIQICKTLWS